MILRDTYLRITRWEVPPGTIAGSLRRLALVSRPVYMVEGVLLKDVQVGAPILFRACFRLGRPYRRIYLSSPVVILEGEFVLTHRGAVSDFAGPPYDRAQFGAGHLDSRGKREFGRATFDPAHEELLLPRHSVLGANEDISPGFEHLGANGLSVCCVGRIPATPATSRRSIKVSCGSKRERPKPGDPRKRANPSP